MEHASGGQKAFDRPWPLELNMSEEVKKRIDQLWPKLG
jgi:3-polyprenyl-4-hydroxybenzoate decarboxylase